MSQRNDKTTPDDMQDDMPRDDSITEVSSDTAVEAELVDEIVSDEPNSELASLSHDDLVDQLSEALDQIKDMKDGYLRAKAEMENVRRRSENEVIAARKFAVEGFAQELLNVKDSLDQAAKVDLDESAIEAVANMKEGLELTLKQFDAAMTKFAVTEVEAGAGVKFNPDQHQAISMVPAESIEADHIVDVVQKGYLLKDRLLRPAMVVVSNG